MPAVESISLSIASLRGHLYGVEIRRLNEQIKRNLDRFPADFMFRLTTEAFHSLSSQIATLKTGRGQHRKYPRCLQRARRHHGRVGAVQPSRREVAPLV